ncbi:MAG TPA: hypothetical protein VIT65_21985 [Microlunatus sp.]
MSEGTRQLEILLDAVGAFAGTDDSWLLDQRFSYLLSEEQRQRATNLRSVALVIRSADSRPEAWDARVACRALPLTEHTPWTRQVQPRFVGQALRASRTVLDLRDELEGECEHGGLSCVSPARRLRPSH